MHLPSDLVVVSQSLHTAVVELAQRRTQKVRLCCSTPGYVHIYIMMSEILGNQAIHRSLLAQWRSYLNATCSLAFLSLVAYIEGLGRVEGSLSNIKTNVQAK
jgi:hypothetical protein